MSPLDVVACATFDRYRYVSTVVRATLERIKKITDASVRSCQLHRIFHREIYAVLQAEIDLTGCVTPAPVIHRIRRCIPLERVYDRLDAMSGFRVHVHVCM